MILTVSNLYPRPDAPHRGLFNSQLFGALSAQLGEAGLINLCLVPEWRPWRRPGVRAGVSPVPAGPPTRYEPVFYLPLLGRSLAHRLYALGGRRQRQFMEGVSCVYASWLYPDGVVAARLAHAARKPCWIMVLGTDTFHLDHAWRRRAILAAGETVEGFICVAHPLAERLARAGIAASKIHVVPNGVDADRFQYRDRVAARRELAGAWQSHDTRLPAGFLDPDKRLVLYVGNLVPVKGADGLLRGIAGLCRKGAEQAALRVAVIGDGPMKDELAAQASRDGTRDRLVLLGNRPHDEVAAWMNAADCLCLSSRSEGMPNVVLEALASGLPVVACDVGNVREIMGHEETCRVVPPNDAEALAKAMEAVLASSPDRQALASRHGAYSWRDQAARILTVIGHEPSGEHK